MSCNDGQIGLLDGAGALNLFLARELGIPRTQRPARVRSGLAPALGERTVLPFRTRPVGSEATSAPFRSSRESPSSRSPSPLVGTAARISAVRPVRVVRARRWLDDVRDAGRLARCVARGASGEPRGRARSRQGRRDFGSSARSLRRGAQPRGEYGRCLHARRREWGHRRGLPRSLRLHAYVRKADAAWRAPSRRRKSSR